MAYDEGLAQRMREQLDARSDIVEKKMFGGVCFLLSGNMACGVHKDRMIVRVGPHASLQTDPHRVGIRGFRTRACGQGRTGH